MFTVLREDNGLTYSSYANTDFFEHMGDIKLYAECDTSKLFKNGSKPGVFPLLTKMIRDLIKNGVTEEEVRTSKRFLEATQKMKSEDAEVIGKYNGKNELFDMFDAPHYKDKFDRLIRPITKADVDECLRKYMKREGMVVSIVSASPPTEKQLLKFISVI